MRKTLFRAAVALLTFGVGLVSSFLSNSQPAPDHLTNLIPPVASIRKGCGLQRSESLTKPAGRCFPGLSLELSELTNQAGYFPVGIFADRDSFIVNWYSKHLRAMGEQSYLRSDVFGFGDYRFLWLRSFHHPVSVRIWRVDDVSYISVKELSGAGGYEPGKLIVNKTRLLKSHEWPAFQRLIEDSCFWGLPTREESMGNDGAQWILEGVSRGRYHVVDRWTPRSGKYREACLYLLKISDLGIDEASEDLY